MLYLDFIQVITENLRVVRLMLTDHFIDLENAQRLSQILEQFASMCYLEGDACNDVHAINQQILYNEGAFDLVLDIVAGNIDSETEV